VTEPPFLLVLGQDALEGFRSTLDIKREALDTWQEVSLSTSFSG
jgi:hypothetical protein